MKEPEPGSCALLILAVRVPAAGTFAGCDFRIEICVWSLSGMLGRAGAQDLYFQGC